MKPEENHTFVYKKKTRIPEWIQFHYHGVSDTNTLILTEQFQKLSHGEIALRQQATRCS